MTIESVCPNCYKEGETRLLLTTIPFFKDVIISSFTCSHCYHKNTNVQNSGKLAEFGVDLLLTVTSKEDLARDIVRGEWATTYVPELQLEIPCTKKGYMSTLEGFLTSFKEDLEMGQGERRKQNPDYADQIDDFILKINKYINADEEILPFTFRLVDPSGNSFVQNPNAPNPDKNLKIEKFTRTPEHLEVKKNSKNFFKGFFHKTN